MTVASLCRQHGMSDATFCKYGGMDVSEARRLRGLEEENQRLKGLVAEQALGHPGAQGSPRKKRVEPAEGRLAVRHAIDVHSYSERRACQLTEMNRRTLDDRQARSAMRSCASVCVVWPRSTDALAAHGCRSYCAVASVSGGRAVLRLKHRRKRTSHLRVVPPGPTRPS